MDKSGLIEASIGKLLTPIGFSYEGLISENLWMFIRDLSAKDAPLPYVQEVRVQKSNWGNDLYLRIKTNYNGQYRIFNIDNFVPDEKRHEIKYADDNGFSDVILYFSQLMEQYGVPFLESTKTPPSTEHLPSKEDNKNVYDNHEKLSVEFSSTQNIDLDCTQDELTVMMAKQFAALRGASYQEAKSVLMPLASFCGTWLFKQFNGEWQYSENKSVGTVELKLEVPITPPMALPPELSNRKSRLRTIYIAILGAMANTLKNSQNIQDDSAMHEFINSVISSLIK